MKTEFVFEWMSLEPITVGLDMELPEAKQRLDDYHIQRLLVVDHQGKLVGIVTKSDLREALPIDAKRRIEAQDNQSTRRLTVKDIMTPHPITVDTTDTVGRAAILMLTNKISGLPVVAPVDKQLLGIITVSDIFTMVAHKWEIQPVKTT